MFSDFSEYFKGPKVKYKLHYGRCTGPTLGMPHGTTPAANIIKSMYTSVKSREKFANKLGNEFECSLGVRQGECLSPLLFLFI